MDRISGLGCCCYSNDRVSKTSGISVGEASIYRARRAGLLRRDVHSDWLISNREDVLPYTKAVPKELVVRSISSKFDCFYIDSIMLMRRFCIKVRFY